MKEPVLSICLESPFTANNLAAFVDYCLNNGIPGDVELGLEATQNADDTLTVWIDANTEEHR